MRAEVAGREWEIAALAVPQQIEVETILLRLFGAGLGTAVASGVQGLAPALIGFLRDIAGDGDDFDLANLLDAFSDDESEGLDSADPRLKAAWDSLLGSLAETAGDLVERALPAITDRLALADVRRLFELLVLGRCIVMLDGKPFVVRDWDRLSELLIGAGPAAKWDLLYASLRVTYFPASEVEIEAALADEGQDGEA